ncbi:MAG: hypothetical protein Q9182_001793 [Xanthomendoza sp. 2 TL-2023]
MHFIQKYGGIRMFFAKVPDKPNTLMKKYIRIDEEQLTHYLYLRPHEPKLPTPAAARSLFLVNVPFDSTELHIRRLLSNQLVLPAGRIEEVQFEGSQKRIGSAEASATEPRKAKKGKKRKRGPEPGDIEELEGTAFPDTWDRELRTNGRTAVVLFVDRVSMEAAYKAVSRIQKEGPLPVWAEGIQDKVPPLGSASRSHIEQVCVRRLITIGYRTHHGLQYPNKNHILESVNTYMTEYAAREAAHARLQARQRQVPDEEGFITVTKGGRIAPARQDIAQDLAVKQKEKQNGFGDFYRFQMRDRKKAKAAELMRKFEDDKEKIQQMKERRGMFRVSHCIGFSPVRSPLTVS